MHTYLVTLWNPEDGEHYLAADGRTTTCEACAARFTDINHAETAAARIVRDGWAYAIEEDEL
jgi:transcriptional regulator NrdR family protein